MLSFNDFFADCSGLWRTDRTYHYMVDGTIERSYTEFQVTPIESSDKQRILSGFASTVSGHTSVKDEHCPGFAIAFETRSETGEEVSMSLKALFVPGDAFNAPPQLPMSTFPLASAVPENEELIRGFYLRDEGYSEGGAIAGRFTYQPTRQTLEMTTYYRRSVAVDQMRFVAPNLRMRTIVTYQRPEDSTQPPSVINLLGFGVERKESDRLKDAL
jgi:hypothetical protein